MFRKFYLKSIDLHIIAIKYLNEELKLTKAILAETERDLHEAKHSAKYLKEQVRELETELEQLAKKKKKK
jgi:chromosome segregation ATPase